MAWLLACAASGCSSGAGPQAGRPADPASAVQVLEYRVRASPDLGVIEVRLCFPGASPDRLVPVRPTGRHYLRWATDSHGRPLVRKQSALLVPRSDGGGCVAYGIDVALAARSSRHVSFHGRDLLTSSGVWLWRPEPLGPRARAQVRFELPPGTRAQTPWPVVHDGVHRLDRTALHLHAYVAFGGLEPRALNVGGVSLRYVRLGGDVDPPHAAVRELLASAARAAATTGGGLPTEPITVFVVPAPAGDGPVAFGMVHRGGGPSVMLMVREGAEPAELARDWVAVHELSHLVVPLVRRRDAWLSEGIATYYQEVARARAGMLTPLEAWSHMAAGFERGRRAGTGRSLRDESAALQRTGAYRRVYWAGAAFALHADVRLRAEHGSSLDAVLGGLRAEFERTHRPRSARELIRRMDRVSGTRVFSSLAARCLRSAEFPDVAALFARMGLRRDDANRLTLSDGAPLAPVRDAIMEAPRARPVGVAGVSEPGP
jgi:hypothetical protein